MCVKKIVCLAMCVKKIDCRQPADLYIKKTAKKIKRRPKLFLAPLGQQFHLIGILYIPILGTADFLQLLWNRNLRDNIMVAVELCPGKKSLSLLKVLVRKKNHTLPPAIKWSAPNKLLTFRISVSTLPGKTRHTTVGYRSNRSCLPSLSLVSNCVTV